MKENLLKEMQTKLEHIPKGKIVIKKHSTEQENSMLPSHPFCACSDGRGYMEYFSVYPGIEVSFSNYLADHFKDRHAPLSSVLQINHCHFGRMGWDMENGTTIYLGPGDLSLHMLDTCAHSEIRFPLGYYSGLSISIDLGIFREHTPEILRDASINGASLYQKFCEQETYTAMPANSKIEHIFSELYDLPNEMLLPYLKLKVQELLLFLEMVEPKHEKRLTPYLSEQVETIQRIHAQLIKHPEKRYTIEELSRQYLINTSTLKDTFKNIYGMPIATYMKNHRMKQAADLLRNTNDAISQIALAVGYENQSKFTNAFKDVYQILPTAYRKQYFASAGDKSLQT